MSTKYSLRRMKEAWTSSSRSAPWMSCVCHNNFSNNGAVVSRGDERGGYDARAGGFHPTQTAFLAHHPTNVNSRKSATFDHRPSHMEKMHGIYSSFVLNRDLPADAPDSTYRAHLSLPVEKFYCPMPGCRGGFSTEASL